MSDFVQRSLAQIEADPISVIVAIRPAVPDLTWQGFGECTYYGKPSFTQDRERMVTPWCVGHFVRAAQWLDQAPRRVGINRLKTTYGWKHVAERWHYERDLVNDYYIGNGMFIAAAYVLGMRVVRCATGPNALLNLSMRARANGSQAQVRKAEVAR